ncbi:MAG: GLPGLI family protein [Chitinophagaceae bacterium]|jgi:GLPGLI family protein|nr:GLPGLI family protein [Chitinophagaceae bacterium]
MRKLLIIVCAALLTKSASAQIDRTVEYDYTLLYNYTLQPSKSDTQRITEVMMLQVGKTASNYISKNQYLNDSTITEMAKEADATGVIPRGTTRPYEVKVMYKVFKDLEKSQMFFFSRFGLHQVYYPDSLPVFDWTMHAEEMNVLGHLCKKATTSFAGRNYIAWYATDIPLSDGPYKFSGLPGLILSIYDTEKHHVFTATSLVAQKRPVELKKWEGTFITAFTDRNEFKEFAQKMKADPKLMFQQQFIRIPEDKLEEVGKRLKENFKKNDNSLEVASDLQIQ